MKRGLEHRKMLTHCLFNREPPAVSSGPIQIGRVGLLVHIHALLEHCNPPFPVVQRDVETGVHCTQIYPWSLITEDDRRTVHERFHRRVTKILTPCRQDEEMMVVEYLWYDGMVE